MSPVEEFAFLDPWHQLLPERGVVGIAGSGGCTTLLLALTRIWRERGQSVLVAQTTAHPVPFGLEQARVAAQAEAVAAQIRDAGLAVVTSGGDRAGKRGGKSGGMSGREGGISPDELEDLRSASGADVMVVQAQASAGQLLRTGSAAPLWPRSMGLALLVAQVGLAGRLWKGVTGEDDGDMETASGGPRRVEVADLVQSLNPLLETLPASARPLPFLTGLGAWRDLDGMFSIVQEFWQDPRVWVVALGELIGDERRDAADLRDLPAQVQDPFANGRIYAVYPAGLDD